MSSLEEARQFLNQVGAPAELAAIDDVVAHLVRIAGDEYVPKLEQLFEERAAGDMSGELYPILFQSADIAIANAYWAVGLTEVVLAWLSANFEPAGRIVELGCGSGLISCFMASRHPDHTIVGVDSCREAVAAATEIAARLKLTNVEFWHSSVLDPPDEKFDTVIGVTVAVEIDQTIHSMRRHRFSTIDRIGSALTETPTPVAAAVTRWGSDNARLLSIERCSGPATTAKWWNALESAGWSIDRSASSMLAIDSEERTQTIPLFYAQRGEALAPLSVDEMIEWWTSNAPSTEGLLAELQLREHEPFTVDRSWLITYPDNAYETFQVFVNEYSTIVWTADTEGFRQILREYDDAEAATIAEARAVVDEYAESAGGNASLVDTMGILTDPSDGNLVQ
jgi:SAM-dependent methyltransferase